MIELMYVDNEEWRQEVYKVKGCKRIWKKKGGENDSFHDVHEGSPSALDFHARWNFDDRPR